MFEEFKLKKQTRNHLFYAPFLPCNYLLRVALALPSSLNCLFFSPLIFLRRIANIRYLFSLFVGTFHFTRHCFNGPLAYPTKVTENVSKFLRR